MVPLGAGRHKEVDIKVAARSYIDEVLITHPQEVITASDDPEALMGLPEAGSPPE